MTAKIFLPGRKITVLTILIMLILTGCSFSDSNDKQKKITSDIKPNIIFILSDDQGWPDHGFMGHPNIETPNIDGLASEGLTFTRGYVAAPYCRPSLASIATGLYPHQHGVTGNDPKFSFEGEHYSGEWLRERQSLNNVIIKNFKTHPNIAEMLKQKGYVSFQTGKWWEGSWRDGGFTDGMTHGDSWKGGRHGDDGLDIGTPGKYRTRLLDYGNLRREGMEPIFNFIDKAQTQNDPFFVWYAPFMPHVPHTPPDSLLEKYLLKTSSKPLARYWAMIEWFDLTVGQLLDFLDEKGLTENTMVVYVVDNGWEQDPEREDKRLSLSKGSPYDMGIRTPIIYKWPGHIEARMDTTRLVSSIDIVPTVLEAVEIDRTQEMEGINVLNPEELNRRSAVFSEDFKHDLDINRPNSSLEYRIVIEDQWKLIVPNEKNLPGNKAELYHILKDKRETANVASDHPEVVNRLTKKLNSWWVPKF